jgi:hypothetical protein
VSFVFSVVTSKFLKRSVYKSASVDRASVETVTAVGKREIFTGNPTSNSEPEAYTA